MKKRFKIKGFEGETIRIKPELYLQCVTDFMGEECYNIALEFSHREKFIDQPFAAFTLNFGEFIGMKNCAYVDTNNCWFADEILQTGIAEDTGFKKTSGFCKYPLWCFKEDFLKSVNKKMYQKYSDEYEKYMEDKMM